MTTEYIGGDFGVDSYDSHPVIMTPGLATVIDEHCKYINKLDEVSKYLVWVYTTGSGGLNSYLILGKNADPDQLRYWVYNTVNRGKNVTPIAFEKYYAKPQTLLKAPMKIIIDFIEWYIGALKKIISKAPAISSSITIYKVSSRYPALEQIEKVGHGDALQQPFNSTTWYPLLNFGSFIAENEQHPSFHLITVPKGTRGILYVPQHIHAYPFEREFILMPGLSFQVNKVYDDNLSSTRNTMYLPIQNEDNLVVGNVYEPDPTQPISLQNRQVRVFRSVLKK